MREFFSLLIMPIPILYLLFVMAIIFLLLKRKRTGSILSVFACLWFFLVSTNPLPHRLVSNLENQFRQLSDSSIKKLNEPFNIIVLGAGHSDDKLLSPNNQLSTEALGRLAEAVRIKAVCIKHLAAGGKECAADGSKVIMSGYSGRSDLAQAVVLYRTGLILGLDSNDMALSPLPANTQTEAEEYLRNFGNQSKLVVVTSAIHMPRAIMLFRKKGIDAIPAPANFLIKQGTVKNPWRWIPKSENIEMMESAVHEYVGLVWYKVSGGQ